MSERFCMLLNAVQEYRQDHGRWPAVTDLVESFDCTVEVAVRALKRAKHQVLDVGAAKEFHHD